MDCWRCGTEVPRGARFCPYCGVAQARSCPACQEIAVPGARFCAACGQSFAGAMPARGDEAEPPTSLIPRAAEAERRHLTVLFSDLVESTVLSEQLDPEDLSDVMAAYEATCTREVSRYHGTLVRVVGDGILCCFGYPRAHEDDAERAVSAGLDLVKAVSQLPAADGHRLRVRVGIATGLVVVTELMDDASGRTSEVVGRTPILAVRLQSAVAPNGIIVADSTRRLVGQVFTFEDLGTLELKGLAEPVQAWRVLSRGDFSSRFEAIFDDDDVSPFVGRAQETELLIERCERALGGQGQAVLISGEAGIGKSRMVHALRERLADREARFIFFYCSPYHRNTPFYPVTALFERTYQIRQDSAPEQRHEAFRGMVAAAGHDEQAIALLAALMDVPDEPGPQALSPQRERELTFEAVLRQLASMIHDQPAVLVFENAHWADPSTVEMLRLLAKRIEQRAVVLIATSRPEGTLAWPEASNTLSLTLNRLSPEQCARMVESLAEGRRLPLNVLHAIIEKSDGVPLFVEETTKALLESHFVHGVGGEGDAASGFVPMAVPATLQDSLMARLDRLAPAREVAQIGAVIGREFSYDLLAAVSLLPDATLESALEQLVEAGVVVQQGVPPAAKYVFKHALLQDAAAESMLRRKRQRLHGAIAEALESRTGERTEAILELLAHHCTEAHLTEKAIHYWLIAGEWASRRSASAEAVAHFQRARSLLNELGSGSAVREQELALLTALGPAIITSSGPGTPEAHEVYGRALELCADLPTSPLHFAARWGWWRISMDFSSGRERADDLLALARQLNDPGLLLQAHHCEWATLFNLGDQLNCCANIEAGLAFYDPEQHRHHASLYGGHDPKVCGLGERALSLWLLGHPDRALASVREGLSWAQTLAHAGSFAHSLDQKMMLLRYRRDAAAVYQTANELIDFSEHQALLDHQLKGEIFRGWAQALVGDPAQALRDIEAALDMQAQIGTTEDLPVYCDMLAEVLTMLGRDEEALAAIDRGFEAASRSGLAYWDPELHRRRAELLWQRARGHAVDAVASLAAARELAKEQRARALELRIAVTALRMEEGGPERRAARSDLEAIYGSFEEGRQTADLVEARQVLEAATG